MFNDLTPILFRVLIVAIFVALLVGIIAFARGYRFDFASQTITPTGILAVTSDPKAAKVYVNGELKGASDINLTLPPGHYTVEIKKEGYTGWTQEVDLRGEIVLSLDGLLFPKNPSLTPLTNAGVTKVMSMDQTGRALVFSQNNDPATDGIYVYEANQRPLSFLPPLKSILLLSILPDEVNLASSSMYFSSDFERALLEYPSDLGNRTYLLSLDQENTEVFDSTDSRQSLINAWAAEKQSDIEKILETFPKQIQKVASDSFHIISFSPDETKILYKAKAADTVPFALKTPLIGSNQTAEERTIQTGRIYVYDRKEDKNFPIVVTNEVKASITPVAVNPALIEPGEESSPINEPVQWYPSSKHLVVLEGKRIVIVDYDGTNKRTIYSGPFEQDFFSVSDDGKLIILTNLNPQNNQYPDLYEVGIR